MREWSLDVCIYNIIISLSRDARSRLIQNADYDDDDEYIDRELKEYDYNIQYDRSCSGRVIIIICAAAIAVIIIIR